MIFETIQKKIVLQENIAEFKKSLSAKPIVFTNGCFDIVHLGHLTYLSEARELGNFLWIGVNSDLSVKGLKGENRPINSEYDRSIMLASLLFVDAVTIFSDKTPISLIELIKPDIHVKGGDYIAEEMPEYKTIISYGGIVKILPFGAAPPPEAAPHPAGPSRSEARRSTPEEDVCVCMSRCMGTARPAAKSVTSRDARAPRGAR
jgi:rfaE bifunctional protein nucleotidyltransferase chain/domain